MDYTLSNEQITVQIHDKGAEMFSLKKEGKEYVWYADPAFWARSTPILFPFVGSVRDKKYRYEGVEYPMGQHGFARDMVFKLLSQDDSSIWFELNENETSLAVYPFKFSLQVGYELDGTKVLVHWKVVDTDTKTLHFSIGGHPAFLCPFDGIGTTNDYFMRIMKEGKPLESISANVIGEGGLASNVYDVHTLKNGDIQVSEELFAKDALVLEHHQADQVSLVLPDGTAYLTVYFDTPLVGLWTPPHKNAPFICIEPWYGRCDAIGFDGQLQDREWANTLNPGEEFNTTLTIEV